MTPALVAPDQRRLEDPDGRTERLLRPAASEQTSGRPGQAASHPGRQEPEEHLLFSRDWPDPDWMVKKRRVGTHSCCAAVAPLCCKKGQLKVNKRAHSTQITFTFRFFFSARPFYNLFLKKNVIVNARQKIVPALFWLGFLFCASTKATVHTRLFPCPRLSGRMWKHRGGIS